MFFFVFSNRKFHFFRRHFFFHNANMIEVISKQFVAVVVQASACHACILHSPAFTYNDKTKEF